VSERTADRIDRIRRACEADRAEWDALGLVPTAEPFSDWDVFNDALDAHLASKETA
jgi:hypothetical protein